MILKREMSAALSLIGRLHDFAERAVDAVANAQLVLEALEVDVRRAALHGVGHDRVDQLDDRRVIDRGRHRRRRDVVVRVLEHLNVAERIGGNVLEQRGHLDVRPFVVLLDEVAERELPGEHREDVVARDELQVIDDRDVARIGHRDGERATVALERQDQVLRREVVRDRA